MMYDVYWYCKMKKKRMIMKILKKGGVVEKRGEEETKSMPHAPVIIIIKYIFLIFILNEIKKSL